MPEKKIPLRKCISCGEMIGKKGSLRVVRDKEGAVSLDDTGKKAGRGAYICRDIKCFEVAKKGKRFERSLKCRVPDEIYDLIEKELTTDK